MDQSSDLYAVLGVQRTATSEEIRLAYRVAARRFHPDVNSDPQAAEEFRRIGHAQEILSEPARRAVYDDQLPGPFLAGRLTASRTTLPSGREPQIVYLLAEISASPVVAQSVPAPPINLCLVIDRSTSMQGARLEQVKRATLPLIDRLTARDTFSVVTFSDRADVVLPAQRDADKTLAKAKISTIYAAGGTEILQGLVSGLAELHRFLSSAAVNQLVLLTDGRTYGDEADCLSLAGLAGIDGITIHGLGIGEEWNDAFLDDLASRTGGATAYVNSSSFVGRFFQDQMQGLSSTFAERLRLQVLTDPGAELQSAFRVAPDPSPLALSPQPVRLGRLRRGGATEVLLQFLVPPREAGRHAVARLIMLADVLGAERVDERTTSDFSVEVSTEAPAEAPPTAIVDALSKLTLYRMQEKAASEAAAGQVHLATQRLERLASRLLASGENSLAKTALVEARRLARTQHISPEGQKELKYGTRGLLSLSKES